MRRKRRERKWDPRIFSPGKTRCDCEHEADSSSRLPSPGNSPVITVTRLPQGHVGWKQSCSPSKDTHCGQGNWNNFWFQVYYSEPYSAFCQWCYSRITISNVTSVPTSREMCPLMSWCPALSYTFLQGGVYCYFVWPYAFVLIGPDAINSKCLENPAA